MKRALALILCIFPAYAQPPFLPVAECKKGVCTMTEAEFVKYQQFHAQLYLVMSGIQEHAGAVQTENNQLRGLLEKNLHCQLGRKI
jgi:hypothetical protein